METPAGPMRPGPLISNVVAINIGPALPIPSTAPPDLPPAHVAGVEAAPDAETLERAAELLARVDLQYL